MTFPGMLILTGVVFLVVFGGLVRIGSDKLVKVLRNGILYSAIGYLLLAALYGGSCIHGGFARALHGALTGFFLLIGHVFTIQPIEALLILIGFAEPSAIPNIFLHGAKAHFCSD